MAYLTTLFDIVSVVFCDSPSQARWLTIRAARDAGYEVAFTACVAVRRAPKYDPIDAPDMRGRAWVPTFADRRILEGCE